MRKFAAILLAVIVMVTAVIVMLTFAGRGKAAYPDLSDDAVAFEMGKFVDFDDDNAEYGTLEFDGRTYIGYGTLGKSLHKADIDQCVGYIVRDGNSSSVVDLNDTSIRVYTLTGDTEHNYLMVCNTATSLMNQPDFQRAVDTREADISTPDYIEPLEYPFWN